MRNSHHGEREQNRRQFLQIGATAGGTLLLGSHIISAAEVAGNKPASGARESGPNEDLMREHGVLGRILLIYDEATRRLESPSVDLPADAVAGAARILRDFIEDFHEKLEEDHVFPRLLGAGKETQLVGVLLTQHYAGRYNTGTVLELATDATIKDKAGQKKLSDALRGFTRMYRPHQAFEDTVVFQAFRQIVTGNEYGALGEEFAKKEREMFGEDGFQKIVSEVAALEKKLGINDVSQFTAKPAT
jgi:hemerythrin-like domain-containing protein